MPFHMKNKELSHCEAAPSFFMVLGDDVKKWEVGTKVLKNGKQASMM